MVLSPRCPLSRSRTGEANVRDGGAKLTLLEATVIWRRLDKGHLQRHRHRHRERRVLAKAPHIRDASLRAARSSSLPYDVHLSRSGRVGGDFVGIPAAASPALKESGAAFDALRISTSSATVRVIRR